MLHSPAANIAFAHYPKTAGHSLVSWFRGAFPDAAFVDPPASGRFASFSHWQSATTPS
jgi:hypothetical protein